MFSFLKKKKIVSHIKLNGVIGNAGKFKQGIDFAGQEEIIKKAFSLKKAAAVAISINSPGETSNDSQSLFLVSMFIATLWPETSFILLNIIGAFPLASETSLI